MKMKITQFRRRREGKTNYHKRLALLKSGKTRLVIRKSNYAFIVQAVNYSIGGDKVLFTLSSKILDKFGWKYSKSNTSAAYLIGFLAGKKLLEKGIKDAIFDIGLVTPKKGIKYYAVLKGTIDAGLNIPYGDESIFPSEDRIKGKHIENHYKNNKDNFSRYLKEKLSDNISEEFDKIKLLIENGN